MPFKSVEDLDSQINRLESQVNGGMMKLVDEKKALAEISNLKKVRKNFSAFDVQEKQISELRASIKQIKDSMDDPEAKALSEKYNGLQAELDAIKAEQDGVYKNLSSLRDERSKLHNEQREKFDAIRKLKDEYYGAKKAFAAYEREARNKAWERKQAERERFERERKKERAQRMLTEASDPAYLDEIRRARSLLHFFDPTSTPAPAAAADASNSSLAAKAARTVDDAGIKGQRLVRKEDREDEYLPATKKSGGKKGGKKETGAKGYNVPPAVIEDCASMGLNPPASAADVPEVIEKIKAKLAHWEADQDAQTQRVSFFFFLFFFSFFPSFSLPLFQTPPFPCSTSKKHNLLTLPPRTLRRPRRRSRRSRRRRSLPPTATRRTRPTATRPLPRSLPISRAARSTRRRMRRPRRLPRRRLPHEAAGQRASTRHNCCLALLQQQQQPSVAHIRFPLLSSSLIFSPLDAFTYYPRFS